ncbi:UNVERIFIED_CONTAM: hypothetical protein Slati_4252600 [Sesamum latifolium]|uniref:Uncharacterized protein n=1 Tax=Sesamum latifolium TaxID=2727402 RepID=A0AAW2TC56_9LAMI
MGRGSSGSQEGGRFEWWWSATVGHAGDSESRAGGRGGQDESLIAMVDETVNCLGGMIVLSWGVKWYERQFATCRNG